MLFKVQFFTWWLQARADCLLHSTPHCQRLSRLGTGFRRYPSWSELRRQYPLEQGLVTLPRCLRNSVTNEAIVTTVTHISHFFSGAIAETELGTGQVFHGEGVVINIEDGHQKKALSNLWHKKVFLLHDCSWLLWMPLHLMIAWHWPIIKWKVPSLMESWIKKVIEESEWSGFFQPCFILPTWRAVNRIQTTNQKNLTITISFVKTMLRTCRGRGLNTTRLSVALSSGVTPTMRFN